MAEKSALYPGNTWEDCIDFVRIVDSLKLKVVSYDVVAKEFGLNSPATKSFRYKVSACKQFGLITTKENTMQLTEIGKKILYPTGDNLSSIEHECFAMPPLYGKLIKIYDGRALPKRDILANIMMQDHGIVKASKDVAAKVFLESAEQLGFIKGGILCYNDNQEDETAQAVVNQPEEQTDPYSGMTEAVSTFAECLPRVPSNSQVNDSDYITQSVPFSSGKVARFTIPIDATEDDILFLHDMLEVIIKRKFKYDIK